MNTSSEKKFDYTKEMLIIAGYILFFCLVSALCYIFFLFSYLKPQTTPINTFATSLPATTPIPHISSTVHMDETKIFEDDFSNDKNHWTSDNDAHKEEVIDGKLFFESKIENNSAFASCKTCPYLKEPYYLQADLATTVATDKGYGIVFNMKYSNKEHFYLFMINTEAMKYFIYRYNADRWSLRAAGESGQIRPFPENNTLGIYANSDTAEFYLNGKIVESYTESKTSFQSGHFNFYVDGSGFKLIVDNLSLTK